MTKLIIVEGKDEVDFINEFLKHLNITGVDVIAAAGKDTFRQKIPALLQSPTYFDSIERLLVMRDADGNSVGAFDSVQSILKSLGYTPGRKQGEFSISECPTAVFILPGNVEGLMLEDLCFSAVSDVGRRDIVEKFMDGASKLDDPPKNLSKARLAAYLATMPEYTPSVGLAAKKGYWNFEAETLRPLKTLLLTFV